VQLKEKHLELIQKRVKELGSYKDFAAEVGVFPETVSRWLKEETKKIDEDETVERVAMAVDWDVMDFFAIAVNRPPQHGRYNPRGSSDNISHFAEWLRNQPQHVQDGVLAVAKSHGYTP
jgi:hypothetical protein